MTMRVNDKLHSPLGKWVAAAALASLVASAAAAPNPVAGPKSSDGFQSAAAHAILIEADSGSVLFEKAAADPIPPAILSKLMTAEVVFNEIKQGRLKPTSEFIVSTNAWRRGGAPSHTSSMFIPIHSKVAVDDLLHGVIIQSANDACITPAARVSGSGGSSSPRASWESSRPISLRPIPSTTNTTASASSPGTRSASTIAIRCL